MAQDTITHRRADDPVGTFDKPPLHSFVMLWVVGADGRGASMKVWISDRTFHEFMHGQIDSDLILRSERADQKVREKLQELHRVAK